MDWHALRRDLLAQHAASPQETRYVELGVAQAQEALSTLARLGHPFHLVAGLGPHPSETWPRLFFHTTDAPKGRVVYSQGEADSLGPGWKDIPSEANQAAGVAAQFGGKAGQGNQALPTVISPPQTEFERVTSRMLQHEQAKAAALAGKDGMK